MGKIATLFTIALAAIGLHFLIPDAAAEDPATVKVALMDMSATAGMGPMGQWMMGPGWQQGMQGRGMMRPGYGTGPGMLGQGPGPGAGMMGQSYSAYPGMMGPTMMTGMMAVRIDHDTIKAGHVSFDVTNWSRAVPHELLIVAVDDPNASLPYDFDQAKVDEDRVKVLGDTAELQPNMSKIVDVTLAPGSYLLICNVAGHYAAGMATQLVVTQ